MGTSAPHHIRDGGPLPQQSVLEQPVSESLCPHGVTSRGRAARPRRLLLPPRGGQKQRQKPPVPAAWCAWARTQAVQEARGDRLNSNTTQGPIPVLATLPSPPMQSVRWCWLVGCCSCSLAPHNDSGLWLSLSEGGRHESALKGPGGARLGWAGQGGGGRGSQALPRSTGERHVLPLGHGIGVAQVTVALFTLASACGLWRPPRSSVQC